MLHTVQFIVSQMRGRKQGFRFSLRASGANSSKGRYPAIVAEMPELAAARDLFAGLYFVRVWLTAS
jgi:hypothetical protein